MGLDLRLKTVLMLGALVALATISSGCGVSASQGAPQAAAVAEPVEVRVSAAATLKRPLETLAADFEAAEGVKLVFNFGASGVLQKQIEGGAPADVFASASPSQVDALVDGGFASVEETATFAQNDVVIVVPKGNPAGIGEPGDFAKAERLATGNPETAPHGSKAKEWLETIGLWDRLEPNFLFGENAGQTTDFAARREVDAAVIFASEASGNEAVEVVYTAPTSEVARTRYVAVPLKAAAQPELAAAFIEYLGSPDGQRVLADAGFQPKPE